MWLFKNFGNEVWYLLFIKRFKKKRDSIRGIKGKRNWKNINKRNWVKG